MKAKKEKTVQPAKEEAKTEPEKQTSAFPREEIEKAFSGNPLLKGFSKYLEPMLNYFEGIESRFTAIQGNFEVIQQNFKELAPLVNLSQQIEQAKQQQQQQTQQNAPNMGGAGLGELLKVMSMFGGQQTGDSKLTELAMKSLEADISLSHTIKNAVSTRILAPITKQVAEAASEGV